MNEVTYLFKSAFAAHIGGRSPSYITWLKENGRLFLFSVMCPATSRPNPRRLTWLRRRPLIQLMGRLRTSRKHGRIADNIWHGWLRWSFARRRMSWWKSVLCKRLLMNRHVRSIFVYEPVAAISTTACGSVGLIRAKRQLTDALRQRRNEAAQVSSEEFEFA